MLGKFNISVSETKQVSGQYVQGRTPGCVLLLLATALLPTKIWAAPECKSEKIDEVTIEMCLLRGGNFNHDVYLLRSDGIPVFGIADDFVEDVHLRHKLSVGPALEFPLSRGKEETVVIEGGCAPVNEPDKSTSGFIVEVARVCNFTWGGKRVVRDVKFTFD